MRRTSVMVALGLLALTCASCASFQATLTAVGTDLGIVAADLPTACGNVAAALTVVSGVTTGSTQTAVQTAQNDINTFCGPAAVTVADIGAAIATLQKDAVALTAASGQ